MNFLDTGKEIGFCGTPHTKTAPNLSLADMCALAWARSNFPADNGPDILEARREGTKLCVTIAEQFETISFDFKSELDAVRAFKQLPAPLKLQNPFEIAAGDLAALEAAMNFGNIPEPAPNKALELSPA